MTLSKDIKDKIIEFLSQNKDRKFIINELKLCNATYYRIIKKIKENKENDKLVHNNDLIIEKINKKKVEKINYDIDIKKGILDLIPKINKYFQELDNNNKLLFQQLMNNNQIKNKENDKIINSDNN